MIDFTDRVVLVTGAAAGIGLWQAANGDDDSTPAAAEAAASTAAGSTTSQPTALATLSATQIYNRVAPAVVEIRATEQADPDPTFGLPQ